MNTRFDGLTALVTGATSGIGKGIADALEASGAAVRRHGLRSVGDVPFIAMDLTEREAGRRLAHAALQEGPIDILVLSASVQIRREWTVISTDELERQLRADLISSVELIQELAPGMMERGFGRILLIGSVQQRRPHPMMLAYSTSKAAQLHLATSLAPALAARGVTINNLAPGVIDTPRNTDALADEEYLSTVLSGIPAGRVGEVGDCIGPALLLCSRDAAYITAQDLLVDGGMHL